MRASTSNSLTRNSQLATRNFRSAFSFTEVLFAVIILGIGFIMIAAIFPVAIQQTKTTAEETTGSTIARGAVNYIQSACDSTPGLLPTTTAAANDPGAVVAIAPNDAAGPWQALQGNVILPNDPRYGWIALYRRGRDFAGNALPYAQVFVIPAESRNRPIFSAGDDTISASAGDPVNLQARPIDVTITDGGGLNIDTIEFDNADPNRLAVSPGTYVIIADDAPDNTGRIFRVGNQVGGDVWELMPGSDAEENGASAQVIINSKPAYIVGRGAIDPTVPTYEGPAMDIGIYTTFVKVN